MKSQAVLRCPKCGNTEPAVTPLAVAQGRILAAKEELQTILNNTYKHDDRLSILAVLDILDGKR